MEKLELNFDVIENPETGLPAMMFTFGTILGEVIPSDDCIQLKSVINQDKGNGHFNCFLKALERECIRLKKDLEIIMIERERFLKHLLKKGYRRQSEDSVIKKLSNYKPMNITLSHGPPTLRSGKIVAAKWTFTLSDSKSIFKGVADIATLDHGIAAIAIENNYSDAIISKDFSWFEETELISGKLPVAA